MSEERRGVHERLEDEGTEDAFSKRGKVNIRYTIASLLEFNEEEAFRTLPGDFNVLLLSELDGATEYGKISCNTSGSFPSTRWDLGFPSERQGNHLFMLSKDSSSRENCSLESDNSLCQQLPSEAECSAGILGPKFQRSDLFQLKRSQNPYRPPHCIKKVPQPLDTSSEHQVECSGNSSFSGTETDHESLAETDSGNSSLDDSWRRNKGSGNIDATLRSRSTGNDDDDHLFDDFWAEILEIVQLQRDPKLSPDIAQDDAPDSEVEISLPGKNTLVSAEGSENIITLDKDQLVNSEWEFNLPDEDGLITIDDLMLVPPSSIPTLGSDSVEAEKMIQNAAVKFRQKSEYVYITKPDDRYSAGSTSGLVSRGQLLPRLPQSQCSEKSSLHTRNDQMSLLSDFMTPNVIPYLPILDLYSSYDFHQGPDRETIHTRAGTNNSLFQYSLWQQPNISPDQLSHLLIDTRPVASPDLSTMQFLHLTPQQATFQGFSMSGKGGFGDKGSSSFRRNQQ